MLAHGGFWILDPVIHLPGPVFLILYGMLLTTGLVVTRILIAQSLRSDLPNLKIPRPLDPYSIAFLRGGDSEVVRTAMVELVEAGWIVQEPAPTGLKKIFAGQKLNWKTDYQGRSPETLSQLQQLLLKNFEIPRPAESVFDKSIMSQVRLASEPYRKWIGDEKLWNPPRNEPNVTRWILWTFLTLEGLAIYKLIHAVTENRNNVGFLIVGLILTPVLLLLFSLRTRLSDRGRLFLRDVQLACASVRKIKAAAAPARATQPIQSSTETVSSLAGSFSPSMLAMGVFGVSALEGSELGPLYTSYQKSASSSGGCGAAGCGSSCGSGSGCGSGSSCGSGCGGGCGGCGGD